MTNVKVSSETQFDNIQYNSGGIKCSHKPIHFKNSLLSIQNQVAFKMKPLLNRSIVLFIDKVFCWISRLYSNEVIDHVLSF